jgi:metal-responsive CopG/Arc/MetJ family transcriptional regulator
LENASVLNIRISQELKQTLDKQAQQKSQTVSDLVREMLEKAVTQDGGGIAGHFTCLDGDDTKRGAKTQHAYTATGENPIATQL